MKSSVYGRLMRLEAERQQFLDMGRRCAVLTLPYLLTEDGLEQGGTLHSPYQSTGARAANVLSSKLLIALFPINVPFFKLQINDGELAKIPEMDDAVRSEIDLSLNKMERIIMQQVNESNDRVALHNAMKHLVVTGNCLLYHGKKALKVYPLDRYVICRDGDGNVTEIITKEIVDREMLPKQFQAAAPDKNVNAPGEDGPKMGVPSRSNKGKADDAVVLTHVELKDGQHRWYPECDGKEIPGSRSSSPVNTSPWIPLTFSRVDGESYGRGRVEEFYGDLVSLEGLMKSLVEGTAAASKVVFLVSPSSTTKPQSLANSANGSIIQGRADDVSVVTTGGKTADFKTVQDMIANLTQRLSQAFLILEVRDRERTTLGEVQAVQQQLSEQLAGIYGNLTTTLLLPYLARKMHLMRRQKLLPAMPKGLVSPTIVAGLNGVGRGQDRMALMEFVGTLAQTMGPEALAQYINPQEFIRRLAAASGIESLGLLKTDEQLAQERQQAQEQAQQAQVMGQLGQLAKSPIGERMTEQLIDGQSGTQEADSPSGTDA